MIFRTLIAGNYIHTDALDALFLEHLGEIPQRYSARFDNLVISIVTREIRRMGADPYTFQLTPPQYVAHQERVRAQAELAAITQAAPGIGLLRLPNFSPFTRQFIFNNLDEINIFDYLIIDLRGNGGGELDALYDIAELFLPDGAIIGAERARHRIFSAQIHSRGPVVLEFNHIVFIQDSRTASASEGLIAALAENLDNITTIGTLTYGKGIGQARLPLRGGFAVQATVIVIETPSGHTIHGQGLHPHIPYDGYVTIDFVLEYLQTKNRP